MDYSKKCQHVILSGPHKGEICGRSCMFNTFAQRTDYCSSHYVCNIINPDRKRVLKPSRRPTHPPFKRMILEAITEINKNSPKPLVSRQAILGYLLTNFEIQSSKKNNHFIGRAMAQLMREDKIYPVRGSFGLTK